MTCANFAAEYLVNRNKVYCKHYQAQDYGVRPRLNKLDIQISGLNETADTNLGLHRRAIQGTEK